MPASWYQPGAFQALTSLDLYAYQLTGTLPASWPPMLQSLDVSFNKFSGTISPETFWPPLLQRLDLSGNFFTGALPVGLASLEQLQQLALSTTWFSGELPAAWGSPGAFKELSYLEIDSTDITGGLPAGWGSPHVFQKLQLTTGRNSARVLGFPWCISQSVCNAFDQYLHWRHHTCQLGLS